ncbi:MAG: ankyrin repeat domain-containing protein, partial [Cytophagales bacterium]|nr:ankyrin repeat domain-containing protein [Cytophagales bacterium]
MSMIRTLYKLVISLHVVAFLVVGGCKKRGAEDFHPPGPERGGGGGEAVSALFRAIEQGDSTGVREKATQECVNLLYEGTTPLHKAVKEGRLGVVMTLLEAHASVYKKDARGQTPLAMARSLAQGEATNSDRGKIDHLLQGVQELETKRRDSSSPSALHLAVEQGDPFLVAVLIRRSPKDLNSVDSVGETPLHYAARKVNKGIVNILIDARATVNVQDNSGQTALHKAAASGNKDIVNALLDAGADKTLQDNNGKTAGDLAKQAGHGDLADLLGG